MNCLFCQSLMTESIYKEKVYNEYFCKKHILVVSGMDYSDDNWAQEFRLDDKVFYFYSLTRGKESYKYFELFTINSFPGKLLSYDFFPDLSPDNISKLNNMLMLL